MKKYKGILGFIKMKYEQFIIREVDRLDLGSIWADQEPEDYEHFMDEYEHFMDEDDSD